VGDQVDCWRPRIDVFHIPVDMDICGKSTCTLESVYSCLEPDCVQLTTPKTQFLSVFDGGSALIAVGRYFIAAGIAIVIIVIGVQLRCPSTGWSCITRGAVAFWVSTCVLLCMHVIRLISTLDLELLVVKILETTSLCILELAVLSLLAICVSSTIKAVLNDQDVKNNIVMYGAVGRLLGFLFLCYVIPVLIWFNFFL